MSRKTISKKTVDDSDYLKGYWDGQQAAFEKSELDAYYAGVGYGKRQSGDKHLGFNNAEERRQFERGIERKDEHFNSYRVSKLSFLERLFGVKPEPSKTIHTKETVRDRVRRTNKGRAKTKANREKTMEGIFNLVAENTSRVSYKRSLASGRTKKKSKSKKR